MKKLILSFILLCTYTLSFGQGNCDCTNCPVTITDNNNFDGELYIQNTGPNTLGGNNCLQQVCFTVSHTWIGDLDFVLTAPDGTSYIIMGDANNNSGGCGSSCNNIDVCITLGTGNPAGTGSTEYASLGGAGTNCVQGNFTVATGVTNPNGPGVAAPTGNLDDFNNGTGTVSGLWTLTVGDNCGADVGQLVDWSLTFCDETGIDCSSTPQCLMTGLTNVVIGACNTATGTYDVTGTVSYTDPPATGQLIVEDCNGNQDIINPPFTGSNNFSLTGLNADGANCDITAYFTDEPGCTINLGGYTAPTCPCDISSVTATPGTCNSSDNTFSVTGTVTFSNPPATGQLIVEDCYGNTDVINAPFASPFNYSINNINSDGTTNCSVTAYFTDEPSCTNLSNAYDHPAPCNCDAYAGTYNNNVVGSSNSTGLSYNLCFGDQLDIISNGDNIDPPLGPPGVTYDPGLHLMAFSCPPTIAPPGDITADPCFLGVVGTSDGAWSIVNNIGDGSTVYYVPITMYSMVDLIYSNVYVPSPSCYDLGPVYEVTYLPEITSNGVEDCQAGTVTVTLNGGDPEVNGTNFTASNLSPASASFNNTTAGNGGTITISGLQDGDNYSFDVEDVNGCPHTFSGGPFIGVEDPSFNYNGSPWCQNAADPTPNITGDGGGTFAAAPAGLSINTNTGTIDLSASTPGVYDVTYTTPDPICFDEQTVQIEVLPTPTVDPITDEEVCHGDNVPAINFTGSPVGVTFDWTNSQTSIGLAANGTGNIASFVGDNTSGSAVVSTITVTPSANGCTGTPEDFTITVNPLPNPTITPVNDLCEDAGTVNLVGNPAGGTFSGTGVTGSQFDPGTAGVNTHTITYDYTDGNGCSNSTTTDITVLPVPSVGAGADQDICDGDQVTLTANNPDGATIVWDNGVVDGVPFSPGATNTYTVTADLAGCVSTDQVDVNVIPLPTFGFNSTDPSMCGANDGEIIITGLDPNTNYNVTYDDDGSTVGPTALNSNAAGEIIIPGLNSGTYNNFIVEHATSGCTGTSPTNTQLTDPSAPTVDPVTDIGVCHGDNVPAINFTSPDAGATFAWTNNETSIGLAANGNGNIATFVGNNPGTSPVVATVTVTPSVAGCVGAPEMFTITINPLPTPDIDPLADVCVDGGLVNLTANPNGGTFSGTGVTGSQFDPQAAGAATHTITYDYTDGNGCSNSTTEDIVVNPLPTPSIDPQAALCLDDAPVTLSGNPAGGVFNGNGITGNDFDPGAAGVGTTTVTYEYTDANGCTNTDDLDISVNPMEDPSFSYDAATYCQSGADPVLNITGVSGGTFAVVPAAGLDIDANGNITAASSTVGTYDVTYTTPGVCSQSHTVTVTITNAPDASFIIDEFHCLNGTNPLPNFDVNNDGTPEGSAGTFSAAPAGLSIDPNTGEVDLQNSTPGTYTITNDINLTGCAPASANDQITIYELPTASLSGDSVVCDSDPLPTLEINLTGNGPWSVTYTYNGNPVTQNNINASPYVITNAAAGTYNLVSVDDVNCSNTAMGQATVTVNTSPTPDQIGPFTICEGEDLSIPLFTSTPAGAQFSWSASTGVGFGTNGNGNIGTFTAVGDGSGQTTTSTITVLATANGCTGPAMNFNIDVQPLPQVAFTAPTTSGCVPQVITFNNTSGNGQNCSWNFGDGSTAVGCNTVSHEYSAAGCYDVTLTTTSSDGCVNSATYDDYICVDENPIADFNYTPTEVSMFDPNVNFINESVNGDFYNWNFFELGGSNEFEPSLELPGEPGEYEVQLTVTTNAGCTDTKTSIIFVRDELIFYVPNTFTPDGDDFNEVFKPVMTSGFDEYNYTLYIFNRWGEVLFESHNANVGWDGTFQGELVRDGTYVWKIVLKDSQFDDRKEYYGHVNVLK